MRIGIDARLMTARTSRGIGRYIEELIRAMLEVAPEHRYILFTRCAIHPFSSHPSVETVVADVPWYGWREQLSMPLRFFSHRLDVLHVPHWNVPLLCPRSLVVTIHDLLLRHEVRSARISTRHPAMVAIKRVGYRLSLFFALRHARRLLVPTTFVAHDLAELYPTTREKIVITGEGMSHGKRWLSVPSGTTWRPTAHYFLYVGSAYPHKGLEFLLDAWSDVEVRYPEFSLKIASADDVFLRRLKTSVYEKKLHRVEFLGYVSEDELATLYRDALAFVFPSRFEGFGLPPLEAMQAGCPVISSDAGAMPEVLGREAAFFFQSGSRAGILQAIEEVVREPQAAREKTRLALAGLQARHDWKKTAEQTLAAYASCLSSWRQP